jgi:hypothetical protein
MEGHFVHVSDGHTLKSGRRFFILENAKTHAIVIAKDLAQPIRL